MMVFPLPNTKGILGIKRQTHKNVVFNFFSFNYEIFTILLFQVDDFITNMVSDGRILPFYVRVFPKKHIFVASWLC